ncbi:hypothetical protein [Allomuricauda sp. SCSIO 65647]|uniref:hypothetical protein n=1 Tax=Allomuricauda sp. SCSIO 65647 TaxID=2908843 RepID=UPI001F1CB2C5|nr:hypothetical protein [Muricauda sp. SCSIO 65647]UJH68789.1 hypothetical protein L0P89_06120 [Muricauda sp. SCSIO 65647]
MIAVIGLKCPFPVLTELTLHQYVLAGGKKLLFTYMLLLPLTIFPQQHDSAALHATMAEKIYLQLGPKVYATDQTIWFKAVVIDTENHIPTELSKILYVDLIAPNEQIMAHKVVKLDQGTGSGFFELQDSYMPGRYLIRAYTQWNRNFGTDFMFKTYVEVLAASSNDNKTIVGPISVVEKSEGRLFLSGQLSSLRPKSLGHTSQKETKMYVNWAHGKDTIGVKRNDGGVSPFEFEIPKNIDWINVSVDDEDGLRKTETVIINDSKLNVRFFPESGKMVNGFRNKIGFKAVGFDGKGKRVKGVVFDNKGNKVTTFDSNDLGMGFFFLEAAIGTTYHAKILSGDNLFRDGAYALPETFSKGSILAVARTDNKIRIKVFSNELKDSVSVKVSCRGKDYYSVDGSLQKERLVFELASNSLPEGIIAFTLMNGNKVPVAERLYFNEHGTQNSGGKLAIDKSEYATREQTKLDIDESKSIEETADVNGSVLVMNSDLYQAESQNIRSYFLLSSELLGKIENPGYYFSEENQRRSHDLDALLLTQGHTYKYPIKRNGASFFWPERGLSVKGRIRATGSKKEAVKAIGLVLTVFDKEPSIYLQQTDSLGRFDFLLDDTYGNRKRILLQTNHLKNKKGNIDISLETHSPPKIVYEHRPVAQQTHPVIKAADLAHQWRRKTAASFDSLYNVTQLEEVVVEGYRLTPERQKIYGGYGEPDVIIRGETLLKKEKDWSYGLFSILMASYPDQIEIERFSDGFMLAHIVAGGEPTLLLVDGRLLQKHEYAFVPQMSPEIVESVELIKYAKFFKNKYLTVFPDADPFYSPDVGHAISIFTKGGVGIRGSAKPIPGTLDTTINVLSPTKEFPVPQYGQDGAANDQKPDLRPLIYWNPDIRTDQHHKASIEFYNGDVAGDHTIIVETISEDGRIGHEEKEYTIIERSNR